MSPEEEAPLRYLMRKVKQLPMPISQLVARAKGRKSRAGQLLRTSKTEIGKATIADVPRFLYDETADKKAREKKDASQ